MVPPTTDNLLLGRQLRCPEGALAKEMGAYIFASNRNMIERTIDCLPLLGAKHLLEIGFGNGAHLPYLFAKAPYIHYTGVERSEAMIADATALNTALVEQGKAVFLYALTEGLPPLPYESFEVCFSVNTYYFIIDLKAYFHEIYSLLRQGGSFVLGAIGKEFGERMPFTKEVFTFYTPEQLRELLLSVGFTAFDLQTFTEEIFTKHGILLTRPFEVITVRK
jgi:putative methyltransferase type 11